MPILSPSEGQQSGRINSPQPCKFTETQAGTHAYHSDFTLRIICKRLESSYANLNIIYMCVITTAIQVEASETSQLAHTITDTVK